MEGSLQANIAQFALPADGPDTGLGDVVTHGA